MVLPSEIINCRINGKQARMMRDTGPDNICIFQDTANENRFVDIRALEYSVARFRNAFCEKPYLGLDRLSLARPDVEEEDLTSLCRKHYLLHEKCTKTNAIK